MKKLILIKIGGSVITDKSKPFTAKPLIIRKLAKEIKEAGKKLGNDTLLLIGHGSGSFGHTTAFKYQTQKGLINKDSIKGFSLTEDAAIDINRIVIKEFLKTGFPVVSFSPLSFIYAENQKATNVALGGIKRCFDIGIIPVVYGDVIMDEKMGFCIFSAEKTLSILARKLRKIYKIEKIIEVGDTNGVYDLKGKTIPIITSRNFKEVKKAITGSNKTDVTGGMIHKVEEALRLVKETKIQTILINGNVKGNLENIVIGKKVNSTRIET